MYLLCAKCNIRYIYCITPIHRTIPQRNDYNHNITVKETRQQG